MTQLEIKILHQDYLLTCPDGQEAQLMEAVERVDQQFQQMRDSSKLRSRERVGVLLAVNLAYESLELRKQLQDLQKQLAVSQGTAHDEQTEADAERLAALEAQSLHDQAQAELLIGKLEQALAHAEPTPATPAEHVTPTAALASNGHVDLPEHAKTLDNNEAMDLAPTAPERL